MILIAAAKTRAKTNSQQDRQTYLRPSHLPDVPHYTLFL